MKRERSFQYFIAAIVVLLSSCASMEAIQKYAAYTQSTIEGVRPIAKDFYTSCLRANSYKPFVNYSKCETEAKASKAILKIANVLDDYSIALSALATDEFVNYDTDINALTTEINNLKVSGLDDKKVDAIGSLAKFVAKAATSAYQQKHIARFIKESNESIVEVSNILSDLIEHNYSQVIKLEISAWELAYQGVERVARDKNPLEWESYSWKQWQNRAETEGKLIAAKNLAKSISEIGETHAKLKKDADNLTSKEVINFVQSFIKEVKPVIKEIQEAFAKN